jgi:uncharacterized repeat protein (TIGR01451 family)
VNVSVSVPSCSISANPSSILNGQSSTLNWNSTNATSCTASNAWSGTKSTSGNQSVSPYSYSTYTLTCNGSGGTATCSTWVSVNDNYSSVPSCSISAYPSNITNGQYSTLNWTSQNATSCYASNGWSGTKSISGNQSVSPYSYSTYTLTCNGSGGTATCSTWVSVNTGNPTYNLSISKLGRNISRGQSTWYDSFVASPNEEVEFFIEVTNIGNANLTNVKVWDTLPDRVSIISDSTTIDGVSWGGDVIGAGLSLGTLATGQTRTIKFRAILFNNDSFSAGTTTLINSVYATADNVGQISDQASIIVSKGEVLGASVVTGTNLIPTLAVLMMLSFGIALVLYCRIREDKVLDYLNQEKGNKLLKFLIKLYFKSKLTFKLATVRFKQIYF